MTWFNVRLLVSLKPGLLDPQAKAVEGALPALGWDNARGVGVGKYIRFEIDAESEDAAREQTRQMADRFLTNPVIEDYSILDVLPENDRDVEGHDAEGVAVTDGSAP